jgi:hypothetical protein
VNSTFAVFDDVRKRSIYLWLLESFSKSDSNQRRRWCTGTRANTVTKNPIKKRCVVARELLKNVTRIRCEGVVVTRDSQISLPVRLNSIGWIWIVQVQKLCRDLLGWSPTGHCLLPDQMIKGRFSNYFLSVKHMTSPPVPPTSDTTQKNRRWDTIFQITTFRL